MWLEERRRAGAGYSSRRAPNREEVGDLGQVLLARANSMLDLIECVLRSAVSIPTPAPPNLVEMEARVAATGMRAVKRRLREMLGKMGVANGDDDPTNADGRKWFSREYVV